MTTLALLTGSTAVPQQSFSYPVLTVLGGPSVKREQWFELTPNYHDGRIVGATLLLPDGMPASVQLDKIESAIHEIRKHIGPDGSFTRDRIPAEEPRTPRLVLIPTQREGSDR